MARANSIDVVVKGDYQDKDINRAIGDLKKLQASSTSLGSKMQKLGGEVKAFGDKMSSAGKSLTASVTLPIVGIGAAATTMAVEFESSMSKIVGLVGIAADEVDGMKKGVIELAGETAKSPQELADALFVVTSAGLRGADAMNALEFAAKAGAAGLGETNDIARAVSGAMNAYGANVVDAARATDVIVATARAGNFETSQFAGAIGRVLPFAKQAGASLEDMGGAVALLTRTNGDAAQSVTQVSALFRAFVVPTAEAKKALSDVGLSAADMRKAISEDGLPAALTMLDEKLGGNREQLGKLLGSSEAASAAFQILDADADTIAGTFGTVNDATGMTNDAFDVVSETAGFKLQQAFTTLKASLIEFGDIIAPVVAQFAQKVSDMAMAFQNMSPQTKQFIVIAGGIAAAIGPLLIIFGKLVSSVGLIIKAFGGITLAGSLLAIKIIAVVAAVAGIVLAFKAVYDRSESLRNAISKLIDTVKNIARTLIGDVVNAFKSVTSSAGDARSIFERIADVVGGVLSRGINILIGYWNVLANGVRVAIKAFEIIVKVFGMVANVIRGAILLAIDVLMNRLGPVSTAFRSLANGVKSAFTTISSFVRSAFNNVGSAIESFINFGIDAVNALIRAYNKLAGVLPGVSTATEIAKFEFKNMTGEAKKATVSSTELANQLSAQRYAAMQGTLTNEKYAEVIRNTSDDADDAVDDVDDYTDAIDRNSAANDKAARKMELFKEKFNEVADRLKSAREEIEKQYTGMAKTVQDAITGSLDFGDALPEVDEEGNRLGGTFMDRLNDQAERAKEFADKVRLLIQQGLSPEAITMVVQEGVDAGTKIANELINAGGTAIDDTNRLVDATRLAGEEVGIFAADAYYGTGLALAKQTEDAFVKRFGEGGRGFGKLNRLMNYLAKSMERTTTITVVTKHVPEGIPGKRLGGPVAAGSPYIVGEAGPELFVPTMPGRIIPNHRMSDSMTGRSGAVSMGVAGGSTINLTVNAGMGTDGPEVGRQIVDALKAYERRNGAVYASA